MTATIMIKEVIIKIKNQESLENGLKIRSMSILGSCGVNAKMSSYLVNMAKSKNSFLSIWNGFLLRIYEFMKYES